MNLKTVPGPMVQPCLDVPFSKSFVSTATVPSPTQNQQTGLEGLQKSQFPFLDGILAPNFNLS